MSFCSSKCSSRVVRSLTSVFCVAVSCWSAGCATVGRTTVDIRRADGADVQRLGGPYYVIDEVSVTKADGGVRKSEVLHEACQRRYPGLFSRGRQATPLLVRRQSRVEKSERRSFHWWILLDGMTFCLWPQMYPLTDVIADTAEILGDGGEALATTSFKSSESGYMHTPLTLPFDSVMFPKSQGWGEMTFDNEAPMSSINEVRLAAFADAIVAGLESMGPDGREALQSNIDAHALYYRLRPYVIGGDIPGLQGKIVHEAPIARPAADGRLPELVSFEYDPSTRTGTLVSDFIRCDALFAQQWTIQQLLLKKLRESVELPGGRAILVKKESLSSAGLYTILFAVVE